MSMTAEDLACVVTVTFGDEFAVGRDGLRRACLDRLGVLSVDYPSLNIEIVSDLRGRGRWGDTPEYSGVLVAVVSDRRDVPPNLEGVHQYLTSALRGVARDFKQDAIGLAVAPFTSAGLVWA